MKIKQEQAEFKPITITLETREEAEGLLYIADTVKVLNIDARDLLVKISNAFADMEVVI